MTTNEQAEARRALAQLIATALDSSVEETPVAIQVGSTPTDVDYEIADIVLDSEWLAGERHRVAEQCAQIAEAETPWSIAGRPEFDQKRIMDASIGTERDRIASDIRAAFPAVGGSTPAVDGEGDAEPADVTHASWCMSRKGCNCAPTQPKENNRG